MAKKDVEIKIRATDLASKNVKKISDALKTITTDATTAADATKKGGGAFASLAADLGKLNDESSKLKAFGTIASELHKTSAALNLAKRSADEAKGVFSALASEQRKNAQSLASLRQAVASEEASQKAAKDALKAKNKEITASNKLVRQAEAALKKYNDQLARQKTSKTPALTPAASALQTSNGAALAAQVASSRKANTQLISDAAKYRAEVDRTTASLAQLKPQVADVKSQQTQLNRETKAASTAFDNQKNKVTATTEKLKAIGGVANTAKEALGGLSLNQDKVAQSAARMGNRVAAAQAQMDALKSIKTAPVVRRDDADPEAQRRVARAVMDSKRAMGEAREEVVKLAAAMRGAKQPNDALSQAFGESVAKAQLTTAAYKAQRAELQKTGQQAQITFAQWSKGMSNTGAGGQASRAISEANAAAAAQQRLARMTEMTGQASRRAATGSHAFAAGLDNVANSSRTSLGMMQRMRGQVLSLIASYVGLHAVISRISGSLEAFRTLEAAQSRLGAVFSQDTAQVAQEVDWLRAQADRLGISFGVLSDQYSKFAVAARQANFSGENTRKMFISVAEAGRVNKLSMEQLNGTFMAIEQIISKGKFTSEEVRRQLGDRLPGAFNLLADAMGLTTMELDKMMSSGKLLATESNLMKFTSQMTTQFGPQLAASLNTLTTDMGRFENDVYKMELALSKGFVPALREALQAFGDFSNSKEGNAVFVRIGNSIGDLIKMLLKLPQYFDLISTGLKVIVGVKLAGWAVGAVSSLRLLTGGFTSLSSTMAFIGPQTARLSILQTALNATFVRVVTGANALRASLIASAAATGGMSVRVTILSGLLRGFSAVMMTVGGVARAMWLAIGGLPGVVITGIIFALTGWKSGVKDATYALAEHERQLGAVREAYQLAGANFDATVDKIKGVNLALAEINLRELKASYDSILDEFMRKATVVTRLMSDIQNPDSPRGNMLVARNGEDWAKSMRELLALTDKFAAAEISAQELSDSLNDLYANTSTENSVRELALEFLDVLNATDDAGDSIVNLGTAIEMQEKVVGVFNGTLEDLGENAEDAGESVEELNTAFRLENLETYTDAINVLKGAIPALAAEMKLLKDITELNTAAWDALVAAFNNGDIGGMMEAAGLWAQGVVGKFSEADVATFGSPGAAAAGNFLKDKEGYRDEAYWDVDHWRVGYGSDTRTNPGGGYQTTRQGDVTNRDLATQDLARRIGEFTETIKREIGSARFDAMAPGQQAAMISMAYNYGSLSATGEVGTFKSGSNEEIVAAIRGLAGHNEGVNASRRNEEADMFAAGGVTHGQRENDAIRQTELDEEAAKIAEQAAEDARKAAEDAAKQSARERESTSGRIDDTEFEIRQQQLMNQELGRQAAIESAIRAAKADNPNITDEELARITALTGQLYDQQNIVDEREVAEERINLLMGHRASLMEQLKQLEDSGDTAGADGVKTELEGINEQLREAIANTIAMYEAMGGPEADAAIAKLNAQRMEINASSDGIIMLGLNASQFQSLVGSFADGMIGALDGFVKKVFEGENALQAAKDAFLQFAASFLREIALMILKQALLNVMAGFSGPVGIAAKGLGGIMGHTGGVVGSMSIGSGNGIGSSPWAHSAFSYHTGGIAGLKPDDVSATLKRNEEILTEEDPRHRYNQGGEQQTGGNNRGIKQVLAIGDSEIANAMAGAAGENVILTAIRRNRSTINRVLG